MATPISAMMLGRDGAVDAGNLYEQLHLGAIRFKVPLDLGFDQRDVGLSMGERIERDLQDEPLMFSSGTLSACSSWADFRRKLPLAGAAISAGMALPSAKALSIARPETPNTSCRRWPA